MFLAFTCLNKLLKIKRKVFWINVKVFYYWQLFYCALPVVVTIIIKTMTSQFGYRQFLQNMYTEKACFENWKKKKKKVLHIIPFLQGFLRAAEAAYSHNFFFRVTRTPYIYMQAIEAPSVDQITIKQTLRLDQTMIMQIYFEMLHNCIEIDKR